MISIITGIKTTVSMGQVTNYSIIVVIFLLLILFIRTVIRGEASNQLKVGILLRSLNVVTIPLLIMFMTVLIYRVYVFSP